MFSAKSSKVRDQQLKVQELVIRYADLHLYSVSGSDVVVDIEEQVKAVVCCLVFDNSVPGVVVVPAASLAIGNGVATGSKITVASLTLAANDVLVIKYITAI